MGLAWSSKGKLYYQKHADIKEWMRLIVTKPPPFPLIIIDEAYIENAPQ